MKLPVTMALIGSPNSGKTTFFNWLTGLNAKAVNYPGSTVDLGKGSIAAHWQVNGSVIDTPGIYGFHSDSDDERVTMQVLRGESRAGQWDRVACIVDGTQLDRQLLLFEQLRGLGVDPILVVTMSDLMDEKLKASLRSKLFAAYSCPLFFVDGRLGGGLKEFFAYLAEGAMAVSPPTWKDAPAWTEPQFAEASARVAAILKADVASTAQNSKSEKQREITRKIDRVLLHPVFALPLLFVVMAVLFTSVFFVAAPIMDGVDGIFVALADWVLAVTHSSLLGLFLSEGVIAGMSAFMVFVPQIAILFFGLAVLEGSGYLSRTVVLVDRMFSRLGLTGRSLVPILVGFACAVPAIMATRTMSSRRDRWITTAIIPLMACSARLPVFALLLGLLMFNQPAWQKGLAMAGLYFLSLILGGIAAYILHLILPPSQMGHLVIELPLYRAPSWRLVLRQTVQRVRSFIERAAPVIFILSIIIWGATRFPQIEGANPEQQLAGSYMGQAGHIIEPIFAPMGSDWRLGVGILSAFAAREVFVSTLAMIFSAGEDPSLESLITTLQGATNRAGGPLLTLASGAALLIFFVVALQCMATVAVAARESGSWRFALGQLVVLNLVAYLLAVATYQILA